LEVGINLENFERNFGHYMKKCEEEGGQIFCFLHEKVCGGDTKSGKRLSKDPRGLNRWINPVDFCVSDTPEILALFQEEMLTSVTLGLVISISMIEFRSLTVKLFIFNMFAL
jgi:hypothetical protein